MSGRRTANTDLDQLIDSIVTTSSSVQTDGRARFDEILSEDFMCSNPDGSLVDRAAFLAADRAAHRHPGLEARDVDVA